MSENKLNLSLEDLFKARFRQSFRGYNMSDVDQIMEDVIEDYATFTKEIERLNKEIEKLKKGYR